MKKFFLLVLIFSCSFIIAQEKTDQELRDEVVKKNEQAKQEWEKFAAPNEKHASLNFVAGSWKASLNVYDDKGNVFRKGVGTCESRWVLGKRFLLIQHRFPLYNAIGVLGYDKYTKKFVSAYADNQGTGIYQSAGNRQADGSLSLEGPSISYFTGKPIKAKYVYSVQGENSYTFSIFNTSSEKALKIIDITYTKSTSEENNKHWLTKKAVSAEDKKDWTQYATPGTKHKALNSLIGDWKISYLIYDEAGNVVRAPEGTTSNKMILGERFALLHYKLDEYRAIALFGYDNMKQKYISLYADTFGTGLHSRQGQAKKNSFVLVGDSIDYATGTPTVLTSKTKIVNSKRYTFELYNKTEKEELNIKKVYVQCDRFVPTPAEEIKTLIPVKEIKKSEKK